MGLEEDGYAIMYYAVLIFSFIFIPGVIGLMLNWDWSAGQLMNRTPELLYSLHLMPLFLWGIGILCIVFVALLVLIGG